MKLEAPKSTGDHDLGARNMFAISFELDDVILVKTYGSHQVQNAFSEIRSFLRERGFLWSRGNVCFGDRRAVNAVTCVLAVQELCRLHPWFLASVRDVRMLRIEDNVDLKEAIIPRVNPSRKSVGHTEA